MRQGQYPTPPQYQNSEAYHAGYGELGLEFLDQQGDFYPRDPGLHGLDQTLTKHLSIGSYANPGQSGADSRAYQWSTGEEQPFQEDLRNRRTPRHSRSASLGVESFNSAPVPDAYRRNQQPRQPYSGQNQHSSFNATPNRVGRYGGPPFAGRTSTGQVAFRLLSQNPGNCNVSQTLQRLILNTAVFLFQC